ncbi:MAG TPA: DUF58 domain-containing protein [Thermoplasmata archaeon]|nr:DUF58 domain-containing protein [Thermoplasmata archaeon]
MNAEPVPIRPPLRWRLGTLIFLASGAALVAAAVAMRTPVPLFLALPLLLAPVASGLAAPPEPPHSELRWSSEGTGSEVTVRGVLRAPAGVASDQLDVTFYRPEPLRGTDVPRVERRPDAISFTLDWSAPYPCIATVPKPDLFWRDSLGLLERRVVVDGDALRVERFPPEAGRIGAVRLRRTTPVPGEIRSRAMGPTGEFFSIRPSVPTDTPRQINWKASARAGQLLANEFQLERTGDLLLLLDVRPSSLGPERDAKLLSICRAAALGLASGFLSDKSRVGLGVFGEFLTAIPLGSGRLQRFRIYQALQRASVTDTPGPSERFAVSLRRYFPPGVTTVLLSPLADDSALLLLSHLRRRGYSTVVLSPSPLPLLAPKGSAVSDSDVLAMRLLTLVRRLRVSQVWRESPVVDWGDYWSLAPFIRYLTQPSRNPRVG